MKRYEEGKFTKIVTESTNLSEVCRKLELTTGKGNRDTVKKYIDKYKLKTDHFIINNGNVKNFIKTPLEKILIENSTYPTTHLKNRLYKEELKKRECELCKQTEEWKGNHMSLILDHKNGINNDHRIGNLQIVCPNCNATLPTHCSKNNSRYTTYEKNYDYKNHCKCGKKISPQSKRCLICDSIKQRKVERPLYEQLLEEINELGYVGTGRKYGVTDNSIRKWKKQYEK